MNNTDIKATIVQLSCTDDTSANKQQISSNIEQAAHMGAELVVLPELHNSLYFPQNENPQNFELAESIPGPTTEQLSELARDLDIVIVSSIFEKRAPGLFHNTAVVIERDGSIAGTYRKMHIPDDPGYYEKYYFTPGDLGFKPINTSVGKLGVLICWDQWFPEAARLMALNGADILIYPTAIGWDPADDNATANQQLDAWRTIQRAHAIANGLPVIVANRCGLEIDETKQTDGIHFWGHSFICGTQGEMLAHVKDHPAIFSTTISLAHIEKTRQTWPFLRDRRVDSYGEITQLYLE